MPAFTLCVELETWTPTTVVCPFQLPFKPTFSVPSKHRGEHATGCLFVCQANRLKKLLGGFHPETPVCSFRWVLGPLKHGRPQQLLSGSFHPLCFVGFGADAVDLVQFIPTHVKKELRESSDPWKFIGIGDPAPCGGGGMLMSFCFRSQGPLKMDSRRKLQANPTTNNQVICPEVLGFPCCP